MPNAYVSSTATLISFNPAHTARALLTFICAALGLLIFGLPALQASSHLLPHHESVVTRFSLITTIAGNGIASSSGDGSQAVEATLNTPAGIAVDAAGNVYIADAFNHKIRQIAPDGVITTLAGTGETGADGDGGQARDARLRTPLGVALDSDGTLYIADTYNHRIRKVTIDGTISTIAGTGKSGFAGDGGPGTAAELSLPDRRCRGD